MSTQQWTTTRRISAADRAAWRAEDARLIQDAEIQELIRAETARGGGYRRVRGCWREPYSDTSTE